MLHFLPYGRLRPKRSYAAGFTASLRDATRSLLPRRGTLRTSRSATGACTDAINRVSTLNPCTDAINRVSTLNK
ncbi:MAG: hypothetical protein KME40_00855 [Komarekiella atlantica HA4396-MV6]|nr:hypothetical protein [Komarekiella atlantica HA4396-MV6]